MRAVAWPFTRSRQVKENKKSVYLGSRARIGPLYLRYPNISGFVRPTLTHAMAVLGELGPTSERAWIGDSEDTRGYVSRDGRWRLTGAILARSTCLDNCHRLHSSAAFLASFFESLTEHLYQRPKSRAQWSVFFWMLICP